MQLKNKIGLIIGGIFLFGVEYYSSVENSERLSVVASNNVVKAVFTSQYTSHSYRTGNAYYAVFRYNGSHFTEVVKPSFFNHHQTCDTVLFYHIPQKSRIYVFVDNPPTYSDNRTKLFTSLVVISLFLFLVFVTKNRREKNQSQKNKEF